MNEKYIKFLKNTSKVDGFWIIQSICLSLFAYCLIVYMYWIFQKPNIIDYDKKFENYSGFLVLFYENTRGRANAGVKKIVVEGDKGRILFNLSSYSQCNYFQDLKSFPEGKFLTITHYNNNIVSCFDETGNEICFSKCTSPVECENFIIQKKRKEHLMGLLISLFISIFFFLASSIISLGKGKNNV